MKRTFRTVLDRPTRYDQSCVADEDCIPAITARDCFSRLHSETSARPRAAAAAMGPSVKPRSRSISRSRHRAAPCESRCGRRMLLSGAFVRGLLQKQPLLHRLSARHPAPGRGRSSRPGRQVIPGGSNCALSMAVLSTAGVREAIPILELPKRYAAWALNRLGGHKARTAERSTGGASSGVIEAADRPGVRAPRAALVALTRAAGGFR